MRRRSSSAGRSTATTGDRRRPTAPPARCRSPAARAWCSSGTGSQRGTARRPTFVFATRTGRPLQQRNVARALREAQERAVDAADTRPSRSFMRSTRTADPSMSRAECCRRCTLRTRSPRGRCSPARASTRWRSARPQGRHRDADGLRARVADARRLAFRRSRMAAEYAGALRVALDGDHGSD